MMICLFTSRYHILAASFRFLRTIEQIHTTSTSQQSISSAKIDIVRETSRLRSRSPRLEEGCDGHLPIVTAYVSINLF